MVNAFEIIGRIILEGQEEVSKGLVKIGEDLDKIGSKVSSFGEGISKFGTKLLPLSTGMGALITQGVKYNAQMEQFEANLTTLLGSSDKAQQLLSDLKQMASTTPFATSDLIDATQVMVGFGIEADKAQEYLGYLGDIAMGDSNKLSGLSLAFSQVQSAGKLTGQDLMQMINQGFNPLLYISKQTGESMAEVKDRMSKGAVSAEEVANAFAYATSEGQPFYQAMEKGAETISGRISTLKDNFMTLIGTLTEAFLPVLSDIIDRAMALIGYFSNLDESQKKFAAGIMGVVTAAAPFLITLGKIVSFAGNLISGFGQLVTVLGRVAGAINPINLAITALIGIIVYLWNTNEEFRNNIIAIWNEIKDTIGSFIEDFKVKLDELIQAMQPTIEAITMLWEEFCDFIAPLIEATFGFIRDLIQEVLNIILAAVDFFIAAFSGDWEDLGESVISIVQGFLQIISNAFSFAWNAIKTVFSPAVNFFSGIWNGVKNIFSGVKEFFRKGFADAYNVIEKLFSPLTNFFRGVWTGIKSVFNKIAEVIGGAIKSTVEKAVNGVLSTATKIINGFISAINGAIGAINAIPGVKIKKLTKLETPKLAEGAVLEDGPRQVIAGEAGAEAIIPLERNTRGLDLIASKLFERMPHVQDASLEEKLDEMIRLMKALLTRNITLDSRVLVGQLAPMMDTELGTIYEAKGRGGRATAW